MKTIILALAAAIALPGIAHAADPAPVKKECCCKKHEKDGKGCCGEAKPGEDHSGHDTHAPAPAQGQ
jgi:hypothetical protein